MSNRIEVSAVEAQFEELAEQFGVQVEDLTLTIEDGPMTTSIAGSKLVTEGDDESDDATEGGDEQTPTESEDTSEAGDDDEDTIGDGEVQCQCGAVFDSKQALYGHSSSCDEYQSTTDESSTEGGDEQESTTEGGDEDSISDAELVEMGVSEGNIEAVREYRSKNGVCSEGDCPYGANDDSEYCASHQGSSGSSSKKTSSDDKPSKKASDLTEAQLRLVNTLIEDEGKSFEEAVQMV